MRTQTSQNRVQFACALRTIVLGVFAVLVCALTISLLHPVATYAATNGTINFQARLETSAGAIVPDGNYNVEFKLYGAASGGTAEWTEDYTYNSGAGSSDARIRVVNGYLSVSLGTLCAFTTGTCQGYTETAPNWNQQQWLTMNIGGTGASGSYPTMGDGEMSPRIQLTAVPYAFTSGSLSSTDGSGHTGTLSFPTSLSNTADTITLPDASGTVCLQNASACGFATGSGSAFLQGGNSFGAQAVLGTNDSNSLAVRTGGTNRIVIDTTGNLQFQQASTLNVAQPGTSGNGLQLTVKGGDANGSGNTGGTLLLQGGAGGGTAASGTVLVKSNSNNSVSAFQVQTASSNTVLDVDTVNGYVGIGTNTPSAKFSISDTAFSDNFNRANSASLGSNWTKVADAGSDFQIVSNQLQETSSDNSSSALGAYTTQGIPGADYAVQSDIVFPSSSDDWLSVMGRASMNGGSDTNGYYLFASMGNQRIALYKRVGTTWTQLGSSAAEIMTAGTTYTIKLVMNGTNLYGYWNGILAVSATDSTYASAGFAGIAVGFPNLVNSIWDNFSITSVNPSLNVNNNFAVTANGWVGIGTTSPSYGLDLQGGSSINVTGNYLLNGTNINVAGTLSNVAYLNQANTFTGANTFKDASNNPTAFQVQNSTGANLFTVDTSNNAIVLGNDSTPSALTIRGGAATGDNNAGSNITFDASNGTGNGGSGAFVFRTAAPINTAVTLDNAIHGDDSTGVPVTTYTTGSFSVASHTNRLLLVSISTTGTTAVNTVTYGSDTLTKLDGVNSPNILGGTRLEVWYKLNPTVQTATVTVTSLTGTHFSLGVASYYNVDQSVPTDVTTTGSSSPTSLAVTTTTVQLVYDTIAADNSGITTNTSGATVRWNDTYVTEDAGQDKAGLSGTTTMSWNAPSSGWAEMAIALNPVANSSSDILADRLHITAAGNVGINTASPQSTLDVAGNGNFAITSTSAFKVQSAASLSELTIDSSGNKIQIGSATTDGTAVLLIVDSYNNTTEPTEVDGAMYYSTAFKEFRCGVGGIWSSCNGFVASNNAIASAFNGNSTSEQVWTPGTNITANTGQTYQLPANYCVAGRTIWLHADGIYSTTTTAESINLKVKIGATVLGATGANTPTASMTGQHWHSDFNIICLSATSAIGEGYATVGTSTLTTTGYWPMQNVAAVTIPSAASNLTMSVTFGGTTSASNTITLQQLIVRATGP